MRVLKVVLSPAPTEYRRFVMENLELIAKKLKAGEVIELDDVGTNVVLRIDNIRPWQVIDKEVYAYE